MKRYSKGIKTNDHTLADVFSAYECNRETQFVEAFFGKEEMNTVIEGCGLSSIEDIDRNLETPIINRIYQVLFENLTASEALLDFGNLTVNARKLQN